MEAEAGTSTSPGGGGGDGGHRSTSRMMNNHSPKGPVVCGHLHKATSKPAVLRTLTKMDECKLYCSRALKSATSCQNQAVVLNELLIYLTSPSSSSEPGASASGPPTEAAAAAINDAQRAVTTRFSLEEALECQICLDVAASPIYSCEEGHILCYVCYGRLEEAFWKKCPSCASSEFDVSPALERMARRLEHRLKCVNTEAGCKEEALTTELRHHLRVCFFRDISCDLGDCQNVVVKFNEYMNHVREDHDGEFWKSGVVAPATVPVTVAANKDERHFRLRQQLTASTFYIWVVIMGDQQEANQYVATISLYGKHKLPDNEAAASWTIPVIPFHEDPLTELEKAKPVFGSMDRKLFVATVETQDALYKFEIKVKMTKIPDCDPNDVAFGG